MKDMKVYKDMLEALFEGIYFVDKDRQISFWNKGAEKITGFRSEEVVGRHCSDNILNHVDVNGNRLCFGACPLHGTLMDGEIRENLVYLNHKDGHRVSVMVKTIPIYDGDEIVGSAEVFVDDKEKAKLRYDIEKLKELTIRDQLTSLPNRRYIENYIESKIYESNRLGLSFGILFMDIDHFKSMNDNYGHEFGDKVLKLVSETFTNCIRKNDMIGRWGGEEFIGIFVGTSYEDLKKIAENLRMLVENSSLRLEEGHISVTISIGATVHSGKESMDEIIKIADENMYKAKEAGRNRVVIS